MTIRFQAQVVDLPTESLLLWLEQQYGTDSTRELWVLRTAEKWLELNAPHAAMSTEQLEASLWIESNPVTL